MIMPKHSASKIGRLALFALMAAALFSGWNATQMEAAEPSFDGYTLKQKHEAVGGDVCLFTKDRLKITVNNNVLAVVSSAPKWQVTLYSSKNRKIYSCDFNRFYNPYIKASVLFGGVQMHRIPLAKKVDAVERGRKVAHFVATPGFAVEQAGKVGHGDIPQGSPKSLDYTVLADSAYGLDPHVARVMEVFLGLPKAPGVPLSLKYTDFLERAQVYLETKSIEKTRLSVSQFDLPKGFRQAASEEDVLVATGDTDAIDMMNMGSDEVARKAPKKR